MQNSFNQTALGIIADTPVCRKGKEVIGFGPTIAEYNFLASKFKRITILTFEHKAEKNNPSFENISADNVRVIMLPRLFWGTDFLDKINVLILFPVIVLLLTAIVFTHKVLHTRGPSSMAFLGIAFSFVFPQKKWWHKFAGNWKQTNAPLFYDLQRKLLRKANHTLVSVNGLWDDSPANIKAFVNPCLFESDLVQGNSFLKTKNFTPPFSLLFVGRIETEKGVFRILDSLSEIDDSLIKGIAFWGGGKDMKEFSARIKNLPKVSYLGYGSNKQVKEAMLQSHFLLLPSLASEGFPKVIAEAMAFGCIPIVSNVSSISQFLNSENAYLWNPTNAKYVEVLNNAFHNSNNKEKAIAAMNVAEQFTYSAYWKQLHTELNLLGDY